MSVRVPEQGTRPLSRPHALPFLLREKVDQLIRVCCSTQSVADPEV
ncbi:hypothetical protein EL18_01954 [Nitratireductor basaltis]|uniref:Uncharacterized protein n=1 Tax=Nitratireductor basaltis TaxID=472175 RepID=A0A084UD77_9HYPH|nr:hypothetical protein EL18_01954 [Nitratireductor basaltis]